MILWVDAQLSPSLAEWITGEFQIEATALSSIGLRDAGDFEIFTAAGKANAIILTKDSDFLNLLDQHGPPPRVIWVTCGNTSKAAMQTILKRELPHALELLSQGERIVEIRR